MNGLFPNLSDLTPKPNQPLSIRLTPQERQKLEQLAGTMALGRYGSPEIFNTDQGSQFTSMIAQPQYGHARS